ncbi:hypothetical protein E2C01_041089 [Portunus trituberculatus]|uniref:Uncharacterized protein n=1 Tax=Portunus trituberculatus TaxID=210409 RepID=A0A5B7FPR3_PORTR|nr:hypothetical protein [Portunus trituberculatus]
MDVLLRLPHLTPQSRQSPHGLYLPLINKSLEAGLQPFKLLPWIHQCSLASCSRAGQGRQGRMPYTSIAATLPPPCTTARVKRCR